MAILFVGIDLAKNLFAIRGVNDAGKPELVKPAVPRAKLLEVIAALPACAPSAWKPGRAMRALESGGAYRGRAESMCRWGEGGMPGGAWAVHQGPARV